MAATMAAISDFLGQKRLALIGISRQRADFSRALYQELLKRGYDVTPVNPNAAEIDGVRCFAHITQVCPPVDGALLLTPPSQTEQAVRECAAAGIKRIWMHQGVGQGSVSQKALDFCRSNGMQVVAGECPFMFLTGSGWLHRLHGFFRRVSGRYTV
ncbi:MAG: CoA-binding protein [Acidobacteria bacterium]|nr:CoA-binding protein [Acidobacteriota bacterium]